MSQCRAGKDESDYDLVIGGIMIEESRIALRAAKNANIILSLCELYGVSIEKATDMYYNSSTAELVEEHVADLHCRSYKYLATLVWEEYQENSYKSSSYPSQVCAEPES